MRFIADLTQSEKETLRQIHKNEGSYRESQRAHILLLSDEGYRIQEIMDIYQVSRETVSRCFDRWSQQNLSELSDRSRSGRPRSLTPSEEKLVVSELKKEPRSIQAVQQKINQQTGKTVSQWTIKRIAKRHQLRWKRMRKVTAKKPNEAAKAEAIVELANLEQMVQTGKIELVYADEAGFSLTPVVPYGWQPIGQTIAIPST